jgi:amino acid permease
MIFMSFGMSVIMSGVVTAVNTDIGDGFLERYFNSWLFAFPVALLAAFTMAPIIRPLVNKIASKN